MSGLFNSFGGLIKEPSGFMPQDDPDMALMVAGSEASGLGDLSAAQVKLRNA